MVAAQEDDDLLNGCSDPAGAAMRAVGFVCCLQEGRQEIAGRRVLVRQNMPQVAEPAGGGEREVSWKRSRVGEAAEVAAGPFWRANGEVLERRVKSCSQVGDRLSCLDQRRYWL